MTSNLFKTIPAMSSDTLFICKSGLLIVLLSLWSQILTSQQYTFDGEVILDSISFEKEKEAKLKQLKGLNREVVFHLSQDDSMDNLYVVDIRIGAEISKALVYDLKGQKLPAYSFDNLTANKVSIIEEEGPKVIFFWFLACGPCKKDIPYLNTLRDKYPNVHFYAIGQNEPDKLKAYLANRKFNFDHLSDDYTFSRSIGVKSYPTTLIVDKENTVIDIFGLVTNDLNFQTILSTLD